MSEERYKPTAEEKGAIARAGLHLFQPRRGAPVQIKRDLGGMQWETVAEFPTLYEAGKARAAMARGAAQGG